MSASLLVPIFSGIQRIQKGIALGDAPARVKTFVLGLSSQDGPLLEDFLQQPGNLGGWNAVVTSQADISAVAELAGPMAAVAASQTAMTAVVASQTAMTEIEAVARAVVQIMTIPAGLDWTDYATPDLVVASETAMTAVAASQMAMTAVAASETVQISISESTTAMNALRDVASTADSGSVDNNSWEPVGAASNGTVFVIDVWWNNFSVSGTTELRSLSPQGGVFDAGYNWSEETPVGRAFTNLEIRRNEGSTSNRSRTVRYIPITGA